MSLKYTCPGCGTPLGYDGLCWKCKCEQDRNAALAWKPGQIAEKQKNLIQNIQRLADMEDPERTDFWQLLGYRNAITPEIQRVALAAEVFWPCELYYHAPDDVRDGLIAALLKTEDSHKAGNLMCCLAFQGDDTAMENCFSLAKTLKFIFLGSFLTFEWNFAGGKERFNFSWNRLSRASFYVITTFALSGKERFCL